MRTLAALRRAGRAATMLRRFTHGSWGTSSVRMDGRVLVLKAWEEVEGTAVPDLNAAVAWMERLRERGVPVPAVVEHGQVGTLHYVMYEQVRGRWPQRVDAALVEAIMRVVDAQRGLCSGPRGSRNRWRHRLVQALAAGDAGLVLDPPALVGHPRGRDLLGRARERLARWSGPERDAADLVHGDLAPENVLTRGGELVAVVDWEHCHPGDAGLDLVGVLFDVDLGQKASPETTRHLQEAVAARVTAADLAVYTALYAVRYAGWAIGTSMEDDVLDLAERQLARTQIGTII